MSVIKYDEQYSYEVFDDGYDLYLTPTQQKIIEQRIPYDKPMDRTKSYEENAILQIQDLEYVATPTREDMTRSDVDFLALMMDVDLPSEEIADNA